MSDTTMILAALDKAIAGACLVAERKLSVGGWTGAACAAATAQTLIEARVFLVNGEPIDTKPEETPHA